MQTSSQETAIYVERGTVAWFNSAKGYGFIRRDNGGPDAYVHYTQILDWNRFGSDDAFRQLNPEERVEFEVVPGAAGKPAAKRVRVINQ